ncbi:RtcB family protein [Limibacter armeniacum]|uniref:RtcB family protein n=1 Tax=Limibacter armeniacum TaxID=466084 RepID=UPI002FE5D073
MKIKGDEIKALGFKGKSIGLALETLNAFDLDKEVEKVLAELKSVITNPVAYKEHLVFAALAEELLKPEEKEIPIREKPLPYRIYGADGIELGALKQMEVAMKLPVAKSGALMPDAHQGYGLPIGGVLATENAVIPYAVGVDIGCRMCMSIFELPTSLLEERKDNLRKILIENTRFGRATFDDPKDHEVLENPLFKELNVVRKLKDRAASQIGSSGGGNHFVEFGIAEITEVDNDWGLEPGQYLSLLSHSGSRGMGASIAAHYTKLAMEKCPLPREAKNLAWLDLSTEAGQEYWLAMNLAGDYASACHHQIHDRIAEALGTLPAAMVENHHNFAWKELDEKGKEVIVHRKGATPAGKGVLGVIPGSMSAPGFIVRGKGEVASVNSASHGAGRAMSRTVAKKTLQENAVARHLSDLGVEVIGSGLDEAPMAYKDIHQVMDCQQELVEVLGKFYPKIVRMCGDEQFKEVD